ncbi:putative phage capsid protein [Clostridium neonatale]|uniref:phage major capsid protein n=1 Tax=Clostridium neonatale TaxID=137838 RepID=UPI00291B6804|nr:phage major capsid protein [Clostridium neonatale]CAI3574056.1 putative phage capsid protein [Clostridium neonatale]
MNRFQLQQMLNGVQADLKAAADKLNSMYAEAKTTVEQRAEQKKLVEDLEEREAGLKEQLDKLDAEASAKLAEQNKKTPTAQTENEKIIANKAAIIKSVMQNKGIPENAVKNIGGSYRVNALKADTTTGGNDLLPKTTSNEVITEPAIKNKLRDYVVISNESNLEIPKLTFSCDDDDYIEDGETAKEIKATGSKVSFGRHESKVFCDVTDTMLLGSEVNLVNEVDRGLDSGVQSKERKMMFAQTTDSYYDSKTAHMSFYAKDSAGTDYLIKQVTGTSKFLAIKKAIADLHENYRENARVIMSYADYLDIIEALANGNASFYTVQPEQILGKPVIFIDAAVIPIVGDLSYLQINYYPNTITDRDKNIKTGINTFALTAWYDIQFRLRSAFRLATVTP